MVQRTIDVIGDSGHPGLTVLNRPDSLDFRVEEYFRGPQKCTVSACSCGSLWPAVHPGMKLNGIAEPSALWIVAWVIAFMNIEDEPSAHDHRAGRRVGEVIQ